MTFTVKIRKLRTPAKVAPDATLIAHLEQHFADGSTVTSGAWFGTDRAELQQRVLRWVKASTSI